MDPTDAQLARAVAAGDAAAEAALAARLAPRVRAYGLRHLREAADDLAQTVVALVIERLRAGRVEDPEQIASFALGAARNTVHAWRRGEARRARPVDDATSVAPVEWLADRAALARCLGRLPERQRTVVVLTYYDDRSGPEIAAELGLDAGNVRVLRHRALASLFGCLEGR